MMDEVISTMDSDYDPRREYVDVQNASKVLSCS
jgi:hypothetical protein